MEVKVFSRCLALIIVFASTSNVIAQNIVNVDDFGAAGDGVTFDHQAFRLAVDAAGTDGIVELTPGKVYILCTVVQIGHDGLILDGKGATIKRCDENIAQITALLPLVQGK